MKAIATKTTTERKDRAVNPRAPQAPAPLAHKPGSKRELVDTSKPSDPTTVRPESIPLPPSPSPSIPANHEQTLYSPLPTPADTHIAGPYSPVIPSSPSPSSPHDQVPAGSQPQSPLCVGTSASPITTPERPFASTNIRSTESEGTPISALVSSIQKGFLFAPNSPMSPPQSYASSNLVDASCDSWSGHRWPPAIS